MPAFAALGKRTAVEVRLNHRQQFGFDGYAAFLTDFAFDVDNCGAVVGSADVADVSLAELVCAQAGKKCGEDKCEIAFGPVGLAIRSLAPRDGFPEALVATSECGARP